ncbi:MAG: phenylalanine--tRNA ligase subunit beta [Dehalococcoidia bacterium]|nr:phenylalanine--tRNA ligase subunit beta [Dehalococcoidia bacterium]
MLIPLSWLKEYVTIAISPQELAHRLTMAGVEVGAIIPYGSAWEHVFVGQVAQVEPHPNADRLTLCTVDMGGPTWRVVCGAPNVAAGQKIAFAQVGASLINTETGASETLKAARIRGVTSEGMICSQRELGLGEDHTGIVVLPADAPLGMPLADYLGDVVLDLEVTANRPDCLSVVGVAREVAALTGAPLKEPSLAYPEGSRPISSLTSVEVQDTDLCLRYMCSVVMGVTVRPSPPWLQDRLRKAGMRPINNVVDITNYVLLEYGQPLHAFDFQKLEGSRIVVRRARSGEHIETLDEQDRPLQPSMLTIADAEDPIALAGVMGSTLAEVDILTTTLLIESASFAPTTIRSTSRGLGLRTEASLRFEKGLRPHLAPVALRRATQLILELAGGTAAQGHIDVFPGNSQPLQITLTLQRVKKVLGLALPLKRVKSVLASLGFQCEPAGRTALRVTVPYWRSDVAIEDDLVEEVARIIGYDAVPTTMLSTPIPYRQPTSLRDFREEVKDLLVKVGMQETISYPLTSREALERVEALQKGVDPLKVANPMSRELEYLRTTLRASVLGTLSYNLRRQERSPRLFEAGRVYLPQGANLPHEKEMVVGILAGPRGEASWLAEDGALDFYDAKGVVEALLAGLGLSVAFEAHHDPFLHPGRGARLLAGDTPVGVVGEVRPEVLERFDIGLAPVAFFELDLEQLALLRPQANAFQPIARMPGAWRDLALVVNADVPAARVQALIEGHPLVARVTLFDVYTGEGVPPGKRSLAYRILFQAPDRTLTSEEVSQALERVLRILEREVGARLRV